MSLDAAQLEAQSVEVQEASGASSNPSHVPEASSRCLNACTQEPSFQSPSNIVL